MVSDLNMYFSPFMHPKEIEHILQDRNCRNFKVLMVKLICLFTVIILLVL